MATKVPIFATLPFSALPSECHALERSTLGPRTAEEVLDELDRASDSGYSDGSLESSKATSPAQASVSSSEPTDRDQGGVTPAQTAPATSDHTAPRQALLDGPPLFPDLPQDLEDANAGEPQRPVWSTWTSSTVTCLDTAFGSSEGRLECIWLVAGCEDGSIWVFCALQAVADGHGSRTPVIASSSRDSVSNAPYHLSSNFTLGRPSTPTRKSSSDTILRRSGVPASPKSTTGSRVGSSSMAGRSTSGQTHHRKTRTGHSASISLAMQKSSSANGGIGSGSSATVAAGRKASATISVTEADAFSRASYDPDKELPAPPLSPPLRSSKSSLSLVGGDRPSYSFEELPEPPPIQYDDLQFSPTVHITLDTLHSPIVSIHILPMEGTVTPFVCLTRDGHVYKLACQDGALIGSTQLNHFDGARYNGSVVHFDSGILKKTSRLPRLFATCSRSGLCYAVNTSTLEARGDPIRYEPQSQVTVVQVEGIPYFAEIRSDQQLLLSRLDPLPQTKGASKQPSREIVEAGSVALYDQKLKGVNVNGEKLVVWSESYVGVVGLDGRQAAIENIVECHSQVKRVVCASPQTLALVSDSMVRIVSMDGNNQTSAILDFSLTENIESAGLLVPPTSTDGCLIFVTHDDDGTRAISLAPLSQANHGGQNMQTRIAYRSGPMREPLGVPSISSVSALPGHPVVLGYSSGHVARCDLRADGKAIVEPLEGALGGPILSVTVEVREDQVYVVAGSLTGCLAVWNMQGRDRSVRLMSHNTFNSPVVALESLPCGMLAVAADGALTIVRLPPSTEDSIVAIPAASTPLISMMLRASQLLLFYENGSSRLWDIDAGQMQKSLSAAEAKEIVARMDGWESLPFLNKRSKKGIPYDLRALVDAIEGPTHGRSPGTDLNPAITWILCNRMTVIHNDDEVKEAMRSLGLEPRGRQDVLITSPSSCASFDTYDSAGIFSISPKVTSQRLLTTVALLRAFQNYPESERHANEIIAYYATRIGDSCGPDYQDCSLDYLADFWLDESNDIRQAARLLFNARLDRLSDEEVFQIVEERQVRLVQGSPNDSKQLLVLGELAIAKQKLLPSGTLRDIADQISRSLEEAQDLAKQNVSLELCIRGFSIFQTFFDAVKVLRSIFRLAVAGNAALTSATPSGTSKVSSATALKNLARQAILTVAAVNAPLFMTILSMDSMQLNADPEQRTANMKLIAFMIRKKPVVLFSSLPRLVEGIVKSLDPRGQLRGAVQQTATVILKDLVNTYPSISFHHKTQRLAVGTAEGACIVYDLKTATRLYILDSHKKRASAVSYSPDGRRLVTVSLEESNVKVWKVGTSLLGLLTPSGPPPQGHGTGSHEPYKTLDFKLAYPEEAMMTAAAQLEWLTVEWLEERRVKVTIRETALTFSVL